MAIEDIDRPTAERRLAHTDRFRRAYPEASTASTRASPGFHLSLDSTAIALEDCVELILETARRRADA